MESTEIIDDHEVYDPNLWDAQNEVFYLEQEIAKAREQAQRIETLQADLEKAQARLNKMTGQTRIDVPPVA